MSRAWSVFGFLGLLFLLTPVYLCFPMWRCLLCRSLAVLLLVSALSCSFQIAHQNHFRLYLPRRSLSVQAEAALLPVWWADLVYSRTSYALPTACFRAVWPFLWAACRVRFGPVWLVTVRSLLIKSFKTWISSALDTLPRSQGTRAVFEFKDVSTWFHRLHWDFCVSDLVNS